MFLFAPIRLAYRLVSLVVTAAIIYLVVSAVQVVLTSRVSSSTAAPPPSAAIVVAGSPSAGKSDRALIARLDQALSLYDGRRAPVIVETSPPSSPGAPGSLSYESSFFVSHGVPKSALREVQASMEGSLRAVSSQLGSKKRVLIVTDAVNAAVALRQATSAGLRAIASPPDSTKVAVYSEVAPLFRNASALAVGRIIGYGRVDWADWS